MKRHFENILQKASRAIRHWWLYLLCGLLFVAAGITVFVFPLESYVTLGLLFGILMLIIGVSQLIVASASGNYLAMRGYVIVGSILDIVLGIFLCINPAVSMILMPVLLGVWLLYHSFIIMAVGGDMETLKIKGYGWVMVGAVLLLLLSIFILVNPMSAGVTAIVVLTGIALIVFGLLMGVLAFMLKEVHLQVSDLS